MTQARGNSQSRDTDGSFSPGIPRPLVVGTTQSTQPPQGPDGVSLQSSGETSPARSDKGSDWMGVTTGTFVKYLTLGYGSSWSMSRTPSAHPRVEALKREDDSASSNKQTGPPTDGQEGSEESPSVPEDPPKPESRGKFLIGLKNEKAKRDSKSLETDPTIKKSRDRITQRTLHMYLANPSEDNPSGQSYTAPLLLISVLKPIDLQAQYNNEQ